ncbi:hypothetical protein J1614_000022, partial [Plenodomus biglobosus]
RHRSAEKDNVLNDQRDTFHAAARFGIGETVKRANTNDVMVLLLVCLAEIEESAQHQCEMTKSSTSKVSEKPMTRHQHRGKLIAIAEKKEAGFALKDGTTRKAFGPLANIGTLPSPDVKDQDSSFDHVPANRPSTSRSRKRDSRPEDDDKDTPPIAPPKRARTRITITGEVQIPTAEDFPSTDQMAKQGTVKVRVRAGPNGTVTDNSKTDKSTIATNDGKKQVMHNAAQDRNVNSWIVKAGDGSLFAVSWSDVQSSNGLVWGGDQAWLDATEQDQDDMQDWTEKKEFEVVMAVCQFRTGVADLIVALWPHPTALMGQQDLGR